MLIQEKLDLFTQITIWRDTKSVPRPPQKKKKKSSLTTNLTSVSGTSETGSGRGLDKLEFISLSYHHKIAEPF